MLVAKKWMIITIINISLIILLMNRLSLTAKPYYQQIIACIKDICQQNKVDDTHGLAHALKIGQLT